MRVFPAPINGVEIEPLLGGGHYPIYFSSIHITLKSYHYHSLIYLSSADLKKRIKVSTRQEGRRPRAERLKVLLLSLIKQRVASNSL